MLMATGSPPRNEEEEGRQAAFAFLWVLIAFKVITMVFIFAQMRTFNSFIFLAATFWYFIPIIGFLVAAPVAYRYRLIRMRRRRKELQRSEWMVGSGASETDFEAGPVRHSGDGGGPAGMSR
jgi:hypothetical protein